MTLSTPDLCDKFEGEVATAQMQFIQYGKIAAFGGLAETVKCFEDNSKVKQAVGENGQGKVLVVDGGGSHRRALLGDMLAEKAISNGWAGIIIYGCIRDVDEINNMEIGVRALGSNPMKTDKLGEGQRNINIEFAGIKIAQGNYIYADNNGIVVAEKKLQ
jgi:regulator of ribonuclease activity A